MNEQEQFLKDTETDLTKVDVLEASLLPEGQSETTTTEGGDKGGEDDKGGEGGDLKPRNRRERRLMEKLDAERESNIFQAGKLAAFTDAKGSITEEADYLKAVEQIYGTDSPQAVLATELLKKAIVGARDDAENRAYERVQTERRNELQKQRDAEKELDSMVDEIEEEHNITLTDTQEQAFFTLLQRMSPKDAQGNVSEYADPHAVWEVFAEKLKKRPVDTRAKDLSSRSMVTSGASAESRIQDDSTTRFLKEQGII